MEEKGMATPTPPQAQMKPMTDSEFLTAQEKNLILTDWMKFLILPRRERFTVRLYRYLIGHCLFGAHYNTEEFYNFYFEDYNTGLGYTRKQMALRFFEQFWTGVSVEFKTDIWIEHPGYSDLNQAMVRIARLYRDLVKTYFS
jgi:hypothetical protein